MLDRKSKDLAEAMATAMGFVFDQSYVLVSDQWWLFTRGEPMRVLTDDEVAWHVARNHAPFVEGGITPEHADWWKEPAEDMRN